MIDELIRHCIQEIGYDGEAGTELERLQQFIHDFHYQHTQRNRLPPQRIDDAYRAFVFRALMAHPDVHVGCHVPGIVPQSAAKGSITRKAERGGKGSKSSEVSNPTLEYDWVDPIPDHEARATSLSELQRKHGSNLRIVLTASVTRRMLTGSAEVTFPPSSYKCLQLICRSRQHAVMSTDLGAQMRYDQKTVFYLAKKLVDKGLVVKLKARETGTSSSFYVAAKFLDRCPLYLRQKEADLPGSADSATPVRRPALKRVKVEVKAEQIPAHEDPDAEADAEPEEDNEGDDGSAVDGPTFALDETEAASTSELFEPLDAQMTAVWLSSRTELARMRLYTLMDRTSAKVAPRDRLLWRIGFATSPHRLRRAFQGLLEKMVINGQIEIVRLVVNDADTGKATSTKRGIRMLQAGEREMRSLAASNQFGTGHEEREQRDRLAKTRLEREMQMRDIKLLREVTMERQAHELVAHAGSSGLTLRQLQTAFNVTGSMKRTIEMVVTRGEEATADATIGDLRIRQFHEFLGRERRLRLYSQHAWVLQAAHGGFLTEEDAAEIQSSGGFPEINESAFYTDTQDAIVKTRKLVPEALVDDGRGILTSKASGLNCADESVSGIARFSTPKPILGRPRGRLNNKTIERMKASGSASGSRIRTTAERSSPLAMPGTPAPSDGGNASDQDSTLATPAQSAAKRRKLRAGVAEHIPEASLGSLLTRSWSSRDRSGLTMPGAPIEGEDEPMTNNNSRVAVEPTSNTDAAEAGPRSSPNVSAPAPATPLPATPACRTAPTPRGSTIKKEPQTGSEKKPRSNVTELKSIMALVECVEELGGVLDSLLLPQALDAFVERNKDRYSSQVFNLRERRVRDKSIQRAIDQGTLKRTFVKLLKPAERPQRTIVYLPSLDPAAVQRYCDAVVHGKEGWSRASEYDTLLTTASSRVRLQAGDVHSLALLRPWQDESPLDAGSFAADTKLADRLRSDFQRDEKAVKQYLGHPLASVARVVVFHLACIMAINAGTSAKVQSEPLPTIDISYFWSNVTLELFLGICGPRVYSTSVESAYLDPATRQVSVSELSKDVRAALGLPSDVHAAPSEAIQIAVYSLAAQLESMAVFGAVRDEDAKIAAGSSTVPSTTFELKSRVPLYNWKCAGSSKPVLSVVDVGPDIERARNFWRATAQICIGRVLPSSKATQSIEGFEAANVARGVHPDLLDSRAWRNVHSLRPVQRKFLQRFVQPGGEIPSDELAELASRICLVPVGAVKRFWTALSAATDEQGIGAKTRKRFVYWPIEIRDVQLEQLETRKIEMRAQRETLGRQATLQKARALRARRAQAYDDALQEAFRAAPAAEALRSKIEWALRSIRKRYIESHPGFNLEETRRAIRRIVSSASGVRVKLPHIRPSADDAEDAAAPEDGEEDPTDSGETSGVGRRRRRSKAQQKRARAKGEKKARRSVRDERPTTSRRGAISAHYWTPQRNELLRDAAVILRARDRARGRSDWTALLQILNDGEQYLAKGFVQRQWKQRFLRMRSEFGEEGYLSALERKWIDLSNEARLNGELSDPHYPSAFDFDLQEHIDFLRARIDKNAIYLLLERASHGNPLPLDLAEHDFTRHWEEEYRSVPAEVRWEDFHMQEVGNVQRRFEMLLGNPLILEPASAATLDRQGTDGEDAIAARVRREVAESAVKMVILADDRCEADAAQKAEFCERFGEDDIEAAVARLLKARIIRPTTSEIAQRRRPGSNFALSEDFQRHFGDLRLDRPDQHLELQHTLSRLDAKLEQSLSQPLFVEPVETNGEAACLATLLSSNLMKADIAAAPFADLREHHAFNARILTDEEIEAVLSVSVTAAGLEQCQSAVTPLPPPPQPHAQAAASDDAQEARWRAVLDGATADDDLAGLHVVRELLDGAGPSGVELARCLAVTSAAALSRLLASAETPVFLAGSSSVVVVSTRFYPLYTAPLVGVTGTDSGSGDAGACEVDSQPPRLWTDIRGKHHVALWRKALEALATTCIQRPGIPLETLAAKFRPTLTAVEVYEIVEALQCTGRFQLRWTKVEHEKALGSVHPVGGLWAGFVQ
ncbi:hypothetical protein ACQY0O_001336 [Thecaphora frezii]